MKTTPYSSSTPPVRPDAQIYCVPRSLRALAIACILLFGVCFVMVALLPLYRPAKGAGAVMAFCLPILAGFVLFGFWFFRACGARIATSVDGVWYLVPNISVFLHWWEISTLKERPLMQRLILQARNADRKITLGYELENFDELLAVVLEKTRNRQDSLPTRTLFRASRAISVFLVGGLLFFAWLACLSFAQHAQGPAWFFIGFGILLAWALLAATRNIQIRPNEIILESWLRRRSVPFSAICDVKLRTIVAGKGGRALVVGVERRHKKPITLGGVREGPIALYESLLHHWRSASGSYLP